MSSRGPLDVVAGHGVGDRLGRVAVPLVPVARPPVQLADPLGLLVEQPGPEHVGEEVVVAVPVPAIVERDEEEVRPIEPLEHRLPAAAAGDGVAQRPGEPIEDRGLEQEVADLVGLALEHLLGEVVDDEAVVAGEVLDEPADVVAALHRQRGELQRGDPPLGPGLEGIDVARRQVQAHRLVEVGRRPRRR